MMRLHLSLRSGVPIYVQLVTQIKQLVASGRLAVGTELPPIRTLAEQLLINPNTVARAYRELEQAGIVTSRRGMGTHITDSGSPLAKRERSVILSDRIQALLMEAAHLGFSFEDVMKQMHEHRAMMKEGKEASHE
jgi:GntR family transcriptional regulator